MMPRKADEVPVYYTTYQVSRMLGVSLPTVVNWINAGRLAAHKTPGGHRRIARADLLEFARTYNYPLAEEVGEAQPNRRRRLLVVDDERDFAELIRDFLTMKGNFEVEIADSGFAAGFAVASFKPDIVLLDLMMPDMDGFEVLRMIRASRDTAGLPLLACTAWRDPNLERRVSEEGFDGLVRKPLKLDELQRQLEAVLSGGE